MNELELQAVKEIVNLFGNASTYAVLAYFGYLLTPIVSTVVKVGGAIYALKVVVNGIFKD